MPPKGERIKTTRSKPKDKPKDAPDSGEAAKTEEVVLNLNSKGERWYLDKDRKVVTLGDDALAERDRQQREPDSPPVHGYPRYARMSGHAEMPVAPGQVAPQGVDTGPDVAPAGRQTRGPGRRTSPEKVPGPVVTVESFVESLPANFQFALKQLEKLKISGVKREDRLGLASRGQIPSEQFETFKQAVAEYERLQKDGGSAPQQPRAGGRAQERQQQQPRAASQRQDRPDFRGRSEPRQQGPGEGANETIKTFDAARADYAEFIEEYREVPAIRKAAEGLSVADKERFRAWLRDPKRNVPEAYINEAYAAQPQAAPRQGAGQQPQAQRPRVEQRPDQRRNEPPVETPERSRSLDQRISDFEVLYFKDRVGLEEARNDASEDLYGSQLNKFDDRIAKIRGVDRSALNELQKKDERLYPAGAQQQKETPKKSSITKEEIAARSAALKARLKELGEEEE